MKRKVVKKCFFDRVDNWCRENGPELLIMALMLFSIDVMLFVYSLTMR